LAYLSPLTDGHETAPQAGHILDVLRLAARGESPTAFGRRCIPSGCVAPPSNIPDILGRRALPAGRIAALGATPDFHHELLVGVGGQVRKGRENAGAPVRLKPDTTNACRHVSWTVIHLSLSYTLLPAAYSLSR
jgi:hypothetical protein